MKESNLSVSESRWQEAQAWELSVWKRQQKLPIKIAKRMLQLLKFRKTAIPGDDWNYWWRDQFEDYTPIPQHLDTAIELGCGPYTNMRLILLDHAIDYVVCSDPLSNEYIRFKGEWLAEQHAKGNIVVDSSPAEKSPFMSGIFDLVVMINVLDHVRNARQCLETAVRLTKPEGYFVFGQDLTDEADAARLGGEIGEDIGHPIRLHHSDLDPLLLHHFEPVRYRILSREEGRVPAVHYGTYLFIGRKTKS